MGGGLEDLNLYQNSLRIADMAWSVYVDLKKVCPTIAHQFIKSADSIGANIAEGYGRGSYKDRKNFLIISRGSLYETIFWRQLLIQRKLIDHSQAGLLDDLLKTQSLLTTGYLNYLKSKIP